ncbi:MAG: aspartate--tRNA(Asn) ligase [Nanoarchaeota archaeon]
MERKYIKEILEKQKEEKVLIKGWVENTRDLGKIRFLLLRDISDSIQVTCLKNNSLFDKMNILRESSISIIGNAKKSKQAPGGIEIIPEELEIIAEATHPLPIDVSDFSKTELSKRLNTRFLDTRRKETSAIFKIRSCIYHSVVDFFYENKFILITTPKLTTIGLESGAESFIVDYFGKKVSLAQSPQFYKQMFVMGGFERVAEIGPVFRAEKSHTTRHLTEFSGVDFEMGFINSEEDIMDLIENLIKHILSKVKDECKSELELLKIESKIPKKIPRICMQELKDILVKKGKKLRPDDDLDSEAEKMIGEYVLKEYGEEFVFVTNYPFSVRPFYHMKPQGDEKGTKSFDLLWNGVEVATGAQREHRLEILKTQANQKNIKLDPIYAEIFKYGAIPHGGVGFGLDRLTQRLLKLDNVREAILLPRDPERVTP